MKKLLALLLFVGAILLTNIPAVVSADTATWVDAATVKYGGKLYYDADPSDGDRKAERDEGSGCWSTIKYESDRETGSGDDINRRDEFGDCIKVHDNVSITFSNPEDGFIAGYRKSADTIIIYGSGDRGKQPPFNTFKSSSDGAANTYYLINDDGTLNKNFSVQIGSGGRIAGGDYFLANSGNIINDLPEGVQDTTSEADVTGIEQSCEDIGVSLAWIACGVLRFADNVISWADSQIDSLLSLPSSYYDNPDVRTSWARIRNLSYLILLPIMLVMVLGTALGFQAIDAYTVKKALPRLVAAVLFIALSYDIGVFAIQFTETLGRGIMGLVGSPFSLEVNGETVNAVDVTLKHLFNPSNEEGGLVFTVILGGFIGALAIVSLGVLASYALIFFVTLLTIFLLLAFRQILLILLLVMAPLAILSWIFPANNKLWEFWKGSFSKLLLLFPIVYLLVGAGRIFAVLVNQSGQHSSPGDSGLIGVILKLSAYILPYFFIPLMFKFAGGVFANLAGMASDRERGLFDRQRKFRANQISKTWQDTKAGNRFKGQNPFSRRASTALQTATLIPTGGFTTDLDKRRARMATARSARTFENAKEFLENNSAAKAIRNDDDKLWAVQNADNEKEARSILRERAPERFSDPKVLEEAVTEVMRFKREAGDHVGRVAATMAQAGTGTGYNYRFDGVEDDMFNAIIAAAGDDRSLSGRMLAEMRSAANQSGRVDLGGGGFAKSAQIMDKRRAALGGGPAYSADEARLDLLQDVLQSNAGAAVAGKVEAVRQLAPVMKANADKVLQQGDAILAKRELAKIAGKYDVAAQIAPQNAEALADGVLAQGIVVTSLPPEIQNLFRGALQPGQSGLTYQQAIEALRGDPDFQTMRREYQSQVGQAALLAQQAQQAAQGQAVPIPGQQNFGI